MKEVVLSALALTMLAGSAAFGEQPNGKGGTSNVVRRQISPEMRAQVMAKLGGWVEKEVTGPKVVFLNAQGRVAESNIFSTSEEISNVFRVKCDVKTVKPSGDPMKDAMSALKDSKNGAVLVLCDVDGYPSLLIAPDSRWAVINAAALAEDKPSKETLELRVWKSQWRAFSHLMGAAYSNTTNSMMNTVLKPTDLDDGKAKGLPSDILSKISTHIDKVGIPRARRTTYRKACEEGWAPAPTNDIQKAIWDEVKKQKK